MNMTALNGLGDEYAPAWSHHDALLVYTQVRAGRAGLMAVGMANGVAVSERTSDPPKIYTVPDMPMGAQVSNATWSREGTMVYSAFRRTGKGSVINIMERTFTNGVWSSARFLPECLADAFTGHATISPSGQTMVFTSDREGGIGKLDLWSCKKSGAVWDAPVHMGEFLNSEVNEISPFLVSDDTLYFASDGFGGRGGFDVYSTTLLSGEWQPPVPVDEINTSYDESDFVILPTGMAVFASDRPGGKGGTDLYSCRKK
ncbi:MAG: hypothetical protein ACKOB6_00535 [Candidatus Kapaibacterium sp.]